MSFDSTREHLLSLPLKLNWAGWETNTHRLQANGWSLSAEQFMDDWCGGGPSMRIAMRHEGAQIYGMSGRVPFEPAYSLDAMRHGDYVRNMMLPVQFMASRVVINHMEAGPAAFSPIDAMPQFRPDTFVRKSLNDFAHFATPLVRTQEIILPEEDVSELLERILKMQQPAKTEYFKQQLAADREGMDMRYIPQQKFHAQILSIAA